MSQVPDAPDAPEPPPPQLSNTATVADSTVLFGMFVFLMRATPRNKRVCVAGNPPRNFLVIYFAPVLRSLWLFPGGPLESSLVSDKYCGAYCLDATVGSV
jgi:hypothetical protein